MRTLLIIVIIPVLFICCSKKSDKSTAQPPVEKPVATGPTDICWKGALNRKTQVLMHYSIYGKLVVGVAEFTGSKPSTAHLIGKLENDTTLQLMEFEKDGQVSAVMHGTIRGKKLSGDWFTYENTRDLNVQFTKIDTVITPMDIAPKGNLGGVYQYQFGEEGESGSMEVDTYEGNHVAFNIRSVTGPPAHNVAVVNDGSAVISDNKFSYVLPESDDCRFEVALYNDFAVVSYRTGSCLHDFGLNATLEGVYIKVK